ncbi:glycosyltransferase family 4 protein [Wenzhouxiangella sediminis]|nr:glycosyltransferase family 4 protein [Wenzhouxiangella sediminis]
MARLLFVTSRLPFPPKEGHQLRSWHLLRAAARVHDVTLLSLRRPDDAETLPSGVRRVLGGVETVDLSPLSSPLEVPRMTAWWLSSRRPLLDIRYVAGPLKRAFSRLLSDCDLVHLDMLALAGLLAEVPKGMPSVLNEHNVESALLNSRIAGEARPWRRALLHAKMAGLERFESEACLDAQRVLACSDVDAVTLCSLAPGAKVAVIPNGVDTTAFRPDLDRPADSESLLFVGHLGWFPNRDGIEYFRREILPRLRHRPDLQVDVIGRKDGHDPGSDDAAGIRFHGFVDDLEERLQRAAVFIVPLRLGSGTRLKVLEAMAMGKAIVSTSKGVEGLGLVDGEHALIADTPEAFAAAVERVLDDRELQRALGIAARRMAVLHYDWQSVGDRLLSVYAELLGEQLPGPEFAKAAHFPAEASTGGQRHGAV